MCWGREGGAGQRLAAGQRPQATPGERFHFFWTPAGPGVLTEPAHHLAYDNLREGREEGDGAKTQK